MSRQIVAELHWKAQQILFTIFSGELAQIYVFLFNFRNVGFNAQNISILPSDYKSLSGYSGYFIKKKYKCYK